MSSLKCPLLEGSTGMHDSIIVLTTFENSGTSSYTEDTIGTTVNSPVQWNLYNKDTIGTAVNSPVQ